MQTVGTPLVGVRNRMVGQAGAGTRPATCMMINEPQSYKEMNKENQKKTLITANIQDILFSIC